MKPGADARLGHIERLVDAIDLPIGRWNRQARLMFCNDTFVGWSQRPRDALLGRSLNELYGPAAWAAAQPAFEQAFAGQNVTYERQLQHGSFAGRWARMQLFPDVGAQGTVEAVFMIAFDIHDDVEAREALAAAQLRFERFADNIPYPLTYVDRNFVLHFVNKAYTDATQQTAASLIGRPIGEVRGPKRWAEHELYFQRALLGKTVQYTRLVDALPQGPRWMRTSYVPDLDATGAVVGLYTVTIDVHELAVTQEQLRRSVERDTLTDVLSRRTMIDRIEAALVGASQAPVALYFIDLDGFKAVNDRFGHDEGDAHLVAVGAALLGAVRAEDAVGRFGGDEFLVLAPVRDAAGAHALALHMLEAVRLASVRLAAARGMPGGTAPDLVSASIGYAIGPIDAQHPMALLKRADDAMYAAKRLGQNRAVYCAAVPIDAQRQVSSSS